MMLLYMLLRLIVIDDVYLYFSSGDSCRLICLLSLLGLLGLLGGCLLLLRMLRLLSLTSVLLLLLLYCLPCRLLSPVLFIVTLSWSLERDTPTASKLARGIIALSSCIPLPPSFAFKSLSPILCRLFIRSGISSLLSSFERCLFL